MEAYQLKIKERIEELGRMMGYEVEEEWTPSTLREKSRKNSYIP